MFDRRTFIAGVGAAAGTTLMTSKTVMANAQAASSASPADNSGGQVPGLYRTKVGSIEVTSLFDGGMSMGPEILLKQHTAEINRLKDKAFLKGDGIPGYLNTFLINTCKKLILVDTGASDYAPTTGQILQNLAAAGHKPDDIGQIFLTHAHPDHVKGLLDKQGQPVFKNATVHISEVETKFWFDDAKKAAMPDKASAFDTVRACLNPYKAGGKLETFKAGGVDMGDGITSVDLFGHTPGHTGYRVASGSDQLLIWGDIVHMQILQFAHPDWGLTFDIDPEAAKNTRRKILDEVASDRIRVAGMHLCFPGIGHVEKSGSAYAFVPQMWESNLGQLQKPDGGTQE